MTALKNLVLRVALCRGRGCFRVRARRAGAATVGRPYAMFTPAVLALLLLGASAGIVQAAPAPWYWWVSKVDGQRVCAQHMPPQGWQKAEGPFAQAGCQVQRPHLLLGGAGR